MDVSFTKLSENGQIVIPSEIRKKAGLKAATKFLVFNVDGNIMLKQIKTESLIQDMKLIEKIQKSEIEIKSGKFTVADSSMSDEEIDDLLMS